MSKRVGSPKHSVELKGLKRYAKYNIQVSAATVKGDGPASVPITVGTKQGSEQAKYTEAYYIREVVSVNHLVKEDCVYHRRKVEVIGIVSIHSPIKV